MIEVRSTTLGKEMRRSTRLYTYEESLTDRQEVDNVSFTALPGRQAHRVNIQEKAACEFLPTYFDFNISKKRLLGVVLALGWMKEVIPTPDLGTKLGDRDCPFISLVEWETKFSTHSFRNQIKGWNDWA
ncbi:hypothetical protein RIF29_48516 [Crotalaria pallida]|uniref:Uncharacterized protein n=1 Tax=Crotalaria pallida TaxID=3830 RepID=A0AAN9DVM9_CROPI